MMIELLHGDCRDVLRTLADNSIDSIVTDPPYELGFMGKSWDASGVAYDVTVWQECLRVLKPGGHLLSFGGSRTYHRMACAIEDAGFQIRDQIMWVYGSGFPKSLNISKAIDKNGGNSLRWFVDYVESVCAERGIPTKEITALFPSKNGNMTGWFWNKKNGTQDLTPQQFNSIRDFLSLPYGDISHAEREIVGYKESGLGSGSTYAFSDQNNEATKTIAITTPSTAEAKEWDGWGTALKPAHEPIVLARKPLDGTVANNVLTHGTGGINIDGSRVASDDGFEKAWDKPVSTNIGAKGGKYISEGTQHTVDILFNKPIGGRFPANFIHDGSDEVLELFPDTKGGTWNTTKGARHFNNDGEPTGYATSKQDSSTGSAARFFYCAKASKKDRNEGLDEFPLVKGGSMSGEETRPDRPTNHPIRANHHPTVKPTDLMRYLCRLITPPNGLILDPFTGSGSTGKAAVLEGFNFIGVEQSAEYIEIAKARIEAAR